MKPMGTWNENDETRIDRMCRWFETFWGCVFLIFTLFCLMGIAGYLETTDVREYKQHPVDYGRESVKIGTIEPQKETLITNSKK